MASVAALPLTAKDLASDQEVRWCPGCGDFSVLAVMKQVLASLGLPRERLVFVSGVGCSSRMPYYLNTYGFQTLHGRAPTVATGMKLTRPELSVWVVTGDGDGLSIGANHLIHALRRNIDLKILLFNNEVLGLTRGQYSPTSRVGTRTRANPQGSIEEPLRALTLAVATGATFVARTIDVDVAHLTETLRRAAAHRGSAFVEIYQNCKVFNDGVFEYATERGVKADNLVYLEHGKPLVFGQDQNRGIRLRGLHAEAVSLSNGASHADLLVHDERDSDTTLAHLLSRMVYPNLPECVGVLRCVERPTYGDLLDGQIEEAVRSEGAGQLDELFSGDDSWFVE
jgi:2-oxoglutarate/2-oxoacid ferredoxin oxidoreductase subunit beta